MSTDFDAIVRLCRLASSRELQGATLRVWIANSQEVDRLVKDAHAYRQPDVYVGDQQQHRSLTAIPVGTELELRFEGLTSNAKVVIKDLANLLSHQQGIFLYAAPPEYFLLEEDYATGDTCVPALVQAYQRVPRLFELVRSISDVVLGDGTASPTFVILAGKRMDVATAYTFETLQSVPSIERIDALSVELQSQPFSEAKKGLFKKVLVRQLEGTQQEYRFSEFARRFEAARQAFSADFDLYTTEFNFEKVRESFEQKRLAFVLQLNASTSDLLGKMLAIPVGQGLIVSQLKNDAAASIGNVALVIGSLVFAAFGALLIFNQQHSLKQIKQEISVEDDALRIRFPSLHDRVRGMFDLLKRRAFLHTWAFPAVVSALLLTTTAYSCYAFTKVPPVGTDVVPRKVDVRKPAAQASLGTAAIPPSAAINRVPPSSVVVPTTRSAKTRQPEKGSDNRPETAH